MADEYVDLDALLAEDSPLPAAAPASSSDDFVDLDTILGENSPVTTTTTTSTTLPEVLDKKPTDVARLRSLDDVTAQLSQSPLKNSTDYAATLLGLFPSKGVQNLSPEESTELFRDAAGAVTGLSVANLLPWYGQGIAQAAGSRSIDAIGQAMGTIPPETTEEFLKNTGIEAGKNFALDAALQKFVPGIGKFFPSRKKLAEQAIEIPETYVAKATGQGGGASAASMGGLDSAADFAQTQWPWELNVYQAVDWDRETGKFIPEAKASLVKVRKTLTDGTIKKNIADTRNRFLENLDFVTKGTKRELDGDAIATSLRSNLNRFIDDTAYVDAERKQVAAEMAGRFEPIFQSIKEKPTFKNMQNRLMEVDSIARDMGIYDDPNRLAAATNPSKIKFEKEAFEAIRAEIRGALSASIEQNNDLFVSSVPKKAATAGVTASEYYNRLNAAYQATRIAGDDFSELVRNLSRNSSSLSQRVMKPVDLASAANTTKSLSGAVMGGVNWLTGGATDRYRELETSRLLKDRLPEFIQDVTDLRSQMMTPKTPLQQLWGDTVSGFGKVSQPFIRQAVPVPTFMSVVAATLPAEEAQAIEQQLTIAQQSADPMAEERIMGAALATFPQLRASFAPPKSIANSEWNGVIADPMEKINLKRKLLQATQAGEVDAITAAKFATQINKDQPFTSVPKPLRGKKEQPALPPEMTFGAPLQGVEEYRLEDVAPDLMLPLQ